MIVPPQPISMSSEWQPRNRICRGPFLPGPKLNCIIRRPSSLSVAPRQSYPLIARTQCMGTISKNCHPGDRYDAAAAPFMDVLELLRDFALQVPGQNHDVIRLCFLNTVRMEDRDMRTGEEAPRFIGAAVHGVFDQVLADAAIMQQRGALARSAVARDVLALACGVEQKFQ